MIRDRLGFSHPDILTALVNVRRYDSTWEQQGTLPDLSLKTLRADLDAIIASARGAAAAAGLPEAEVLNRALGRAPAAEPARAA
jgi:hypothetical protein